MPPLPFGPSRRLLALLFGGLIFLPPNPAQAQSAEPKYLFSHLAGPLGGWGSIDATGSSARFHGPVGVAADRTGNVYVADRNNHTVRKITADGIVTTLAGKAGLAGVLDGPNADARFDYPSGIALNPAGTLYVVESGNAGIRQITPAGGETTLADNPLGAYVAGQHVAADGAGNLYVADQNACVISKVTPAGEVTTLAGTPFSQGQVDGSGAAARFMAPQGLAVDGIGNVVVADGHTLRQITPAGVVTTLAGSPGAPGRADGSGTDARFNQPAGVAIDGTGNVYVADTANHTIRQISRTGAVTTLAGTPGQAGNADGQGSAARFDHPSDVTTDAAGNVYVADLWNQTIRKVGPNGLVTTLAGLAGGFGSADGMGAAGRFSGPGNVAVDQAGAVYVADANNGTIRKIKPSGEVSTVAGTAGVTGSADGTGEAAQFTNPAGVAVDSLGNVYVADTGNHTIRKVTPAGAVTTIAGTPGQKGSADGTGADARFFFPRGLVADGGGNVYVADTFNDTIRKITAGGAVSTLAGLAGQGGWRDGTGAYAAFDLPYAIALDGAGMLYVADSNSRTIRKITPGGAVTTLAGDVFRAGAADGTGVVAQFREPSGVAVDSAGNVFVADAGNHLIRRITPSGAVSTIGGSVGVISSADGIGPAALFNYPTGVAVDGAGNLYVADRDNHAIRRGQPAGPPVITTQPQAQTVTPGSTVQFSVTAGSVLPLTYQWYFYDTSFSGATTNALSFSNVRTSDAGDYTVVVTNQLGSIISNKATLTVAAAPVTPAPAQGGGGGGSMDAWFALAVLALAAAECQRRRHTAGIARTGVAGWRHAPVFTSKRARGLQFLQTSTPSSDLRHSLLPVNSNQPGPSRIFPFFHGGWLILLVAVPALAQPAAPVPVYTWTTLSGRASIGLEDGPAADARFHDPHGLALDLSGNLYVADTGNHTIRKISPTGIVTTLAGTAEQSGSTDGTGSAARFNAPQDVAVDPAGNLYVADTGNHTIRKITPAGNVTTLAGQAGIKGTADGAANAALFDSPDKLTVDTHGNVYLANNGIRKLSGGQVQTLALPATVTDSDGMALTVNLRRCPAVDAVGQLYLTTSVPGEILRIDAMGVPTVFRNSLYGVYNTGSYYAYQYTADAIFNGVSGNLFMEIVLTAGYLVRENKGVPMQPDGTLELDHAGNFTASLGNPTAPLAQVVDPAGKWYYTRASDSAILSPGAVYAGTPLPPEGRDGTGQSARLEFLDYLTADASGNIWVAESPRRYSYETTTEGELAAPRVRRVSPDGTTTTYLPPQFPSSLFSEYAYPTGLAADGSGKVYYMVERTDRSTFKHEAFQFASDGTLSSLGMTAQGYYITDLTADSTARLAAIFTRIRYDWVNEDYVAIQWRQPDGTWAPLAGGSSREFKDGTGADARFNNPRSLAADLQGNLFVLDSTVPGNANPPSWDAYIRKISPGGAVTTVGGKLTGSPSSLAVDHQGTFYLTHTDAGTITQIGANGEEVTIGGKSGNAGSRDGAGDQARFSNPWGIALDQQDNLYVIDGTGTTVRRGRHLGDTPGIATPPQSQSVTAGASVQFTVTASSPTAVSYQWYFNGSPVHGATGDSLSFAARSSDAGDYTVAVTNSFGSVTSSKARLTVAAAAVTPPPLNPTGGGGGSMETWFGLALLALLGARRGGAPRKCFSTR